MARYQAHLTGSFDHLLSYIEHHVMQGSLSATQESGSSYEMDGVR